ncbi:MAG: protein TolR [Candidatus Dactylopiibacterium carminicum]|uniref:Protein TolR n=1 Tax=Candidatus Dactylopiibacterium carminicum TaxID=857335 RepID=A0A272ERS3_9RHOO|nr:ExbD/TolR family protein [Candidatus Dactylopiibacterium carminicum]KAF7598644.1 protein TolR [Candidatus Dactylopiibacterium carminicum]PAS92410.1 MAG: protein TolR [Candidatus Dactylopiibacterium carminicum]PAS95997.1 MAG: protein TolR [Candidatus Dactylopiibacterium carminicum]PAS98411.1 MAG: protein TolR [Candidatus Dactylopiibacterium carminicum]
MRQRRMMNQINVVPYIDVMLVLLVIFMVTANMVPSGTVDLPSMERVAQAKQDPLVVTVEGRNSWKLQDRSKGAATTTIGRQELVDQIRTARTANPGQPVVIAADRSIRYEDVMDLMNWLQSNQIDRVGLLVQQGK